MEAKLQRTQSRNEDQVEQVRRHIANALPDAGGSHVAWRWVHGGAELTYSSLMVIVDCVDRGSNLPSPVMVSLSQVRRVRIWRYVVQRTVPFISLTAAGQSGARASMSVSVSIL